MKKLTYAFAVAAAAMVLSVQNLASAQDPFGACFTDCAALYSAEEAEGEASDDMDDLISRCRSEVPSCRTLDEAAMRAIGDWCGRASARRSGRGSTGTTSSPGFCILPDGTTSRDEGSRRCGCPSGTYPIQLATWRSRDRLRSLGVPAGHQVFVCADPLALRGAPGSAEAVGDALAATVATHDAALRALCAPDEGEDLTVACTEAREAFLAAGSTTGPVDLAPIMRALEGLQENAEDMQEEIELTNDALLAVSRRVDILTECLIQGTEHTVSYTDSTGETQEYPCPEILAAAERRILDQARAEAERVAREEAGRAVREEITHLTEGGRAFAWLGLFGLVTFNPFTSDNVTYGPLWAVGGELSMGVSLGGGWVAIGGVDLGGSGPDIPGVTNVLGAWRLGVGAFVVPEFLLTAGVTGLHRFMPDVFSAESIYGGYVDGNIRFLPREEWTPVLSIRLGVGASPRLHGDAWGVEANGYAQLVMSIAHF